MKVEITARHYEASDRVKDYVEAEVNRLEKIYDRITNCKVILEKSKEGDSAEITLSILGKQLVAIETSGDMIKSIDLTVEKMERQILKLKGKRFSNARTTASRQDVQGQ